MRKIIVYIATSADGYIARKKPADPQRQLWDGRILSLD